ncbi:MAG: response regulator transcription factor [Burkholderiales bacterium]|nr:response regulator transcription factor [Burkholderiales bacterium]MDE2397731.1 response regulator transcription factor [Burkholderiales bacterium]MDE2452200.1 response regulator transcription factor [Burkholderiales bacterium]
MASVYLVDDHVILRDAMCSLLAAHGHQVVGQSDDPTVALAELRILRPDVLLVDLKLGLRSGFELLAELRRRAMSLKTIVTTMSTRPRDVAEALEHGADGYVLKGSTGIELMRAIEAVLGGRRWFEGKVAELAIQGLTGSGDDARLALLSVRERQVVVLVVNGQSSAEIGVELHLSPKTVDSYRSRIMAKLGVRDVQGLVRFALRVGLISADEL